MTVWISTIRLFCLWGGTLVEETGVGWKAGFVDRLDNAPKHLLTLPVCGYDCAAVIGQHNLSFSESEAQLLWNLRLKSVDFF